MLRMILIIRAHPRSRGENHHSRRARGPWLGSSPLTRGKPTCPARTTRTLRLIPAHAGKTVTVRELVSKERAHPRSRGENLAVDRFRERFEGSSPLTRGKRKRLPLDDLGTRLIPAHAGKTRSRPPCPASSQAHPRSRGENAALDKEGAGVEGSSPLTRGKLGIGPSSSVMRRLIPAHAGKTLVVVEWWNASRAHPRSRGENFVADYAAFKGWGSSPLTRGKLPMVTALASAARLIPAHAGKTMTAIDARACRGAHPRSRGENRHCPRQGRCAPGSSPLTRGKHQGERRGLLRLGLIPAHAGKTVRRRCSARARPAHPRSRGENEDFKPYNLRNFGSSPLTRGKP